MGYTPTVVFDFDGVIHAYSSGWQGTTVIPDPPVKGIREAILAIRHAGYNVVVVSTRCAEASGIRAVEEYLQKNGIEVDAVQMEKPPAICYIDDRAIQFDGNADGLLEKILKFEPWYEKKAELKPPSTGLRKCIFRRYDGEGWEEEKGWFHRWGVDYEEFETGPGNYSIGIVEKDNGEIVMPHASNIKFEKE